MLTKMNGIINSNKYYKNMLAAHFRVVDFHIFLITSSAASIRVKNIMWRKL